MLACSLHHLHVHCIICIALAMPWKLLQAIIILLKQFKNNAGRKEWCFGVILMLFPSSKCLLINCQKGFFWLMISICEICKSHAKVFLELNRIEHVIKEDISSLISHNLCTKQSNLSLHFLRTENCFSRSFGMYSRVFVLIMFANGRRNIFLFTHALM